MIEVKDNYFILSSKSTSLVLQVNEIKKVTVEYYGNKLISLDEIKSITRTYPYNQGSSISYDKEHQALSLDHMKLAYSTLGKGDFFSPSYIFKSEKSSIFDFIYDSFEIKDYKQLKDLPSPYNGDKELVIKLKESSFNIIIELHYILFEESDVIATYSKIINNEEEVLSINKAMSLQLPLVDNNYEIYSTYGNWAGELNINKMDVPFGRYVIESLKGSSSNRHNPYFLIKEKSDSYFVGEAYGFNFIYSSNFEESIEKDSFSDIRVQVGISSTLFNKELKKEEEFITPIAVMSYSSKGINTLSSHFHAFINNHIIPKQFKDKERPIAYNNWEATGPKFTEATINALMKKAANLGIELFVLDDGWFSTRDDDAHGLGDWSVNKKKLKHGLNYLAKQAKSLNMQFGIWMEPEMVNDDTKVFKEHQDWIIQDKYHKPSLGRNQYVLDLRKKEVQDFIFHSVSHVLNSGEISYLKWDYNRDISDFDNRDGTFFFDYITGLYKTLDRIVKAFPHVLFENCASGGNRFDLGMLCYFSQSWMSDGTDSFQRTLIQEGGLLGYPPSVMSNHVSCKTNNQVLRYTSLDVKFNVASLGVLGYELDLYDLSTVEEKTIKNQIEFYKKHKRLFQYGKVIQDKTYSDHDNKMIEFLLDNEAIVCKYNKLQKPNPKEAHLNCYELECDSLYEYQTRRQQLPLRLFGPLINYATKIHINPEGAILSLISKYKDMQSEVDSGVVSSSVLESSGATLAQEFSGVGYDERVRLMGDFSSRMYFIKKKN